MANEQNLVEISFNANNNVSYYSLQNELSPIKRLYIKSLYAEDLENLEIKIHSVPEFLLPMEIEQELLPRRSTIKFDKLPLLSPPFMVGLNKRIAGEVRVEVFKDGVLLAEAKQEVSVLAFSECNYIDKIETIATFVKRTAEVNKLISAVNKKLELWNVGQKAGGYATNKNGVRYFFAGCYGVLSDIGFIKRDMVKDEVQYVDSYKEILLQKILSPLEMCILFSAVLEGNGLNAIIGNNGDKWYVGCLLENECFGDVIIDDASTVSKKLESGVNDITLVDIADIFGGVAFEKAEKNAAAAMKKAESIEFFLDIRRARIMNIKPLPERIKTESGFDLVNSKDFETALAPSKIKEYKGDITCDNFVSRERQWERRLLDMDMRNPLLNFRTTQTTVKIITANLDNFIENIGEHKQYTLAPKPTDTIEVFNKISNEFERTQFLKPITDYVLYEYKNKRLITVFAGKEFERTLLATYRKEKSIQEESGTATLYLAVGFLKWKDPNEEGLRYAPLLLYPVTITKRGVASPTYAIDLDSEDIQLNNTLLEFLYQEFNLDMRGLETLILNDPKNILSVIARIKKEIVNRVDWEVLPNVYLCSLSFTNYLMWHDVHYRIDKFKESKLVNSLMQNRLEITDTVDNELISSDNAYRADKRIYLPICADSSQYSAIYDSLSKSFVLHGPPGTGKSQTITNIIANNIVRGRRVLFVAEKMAALSVVYKRLNDIGLKDFCLELHSDKTHKTEVLSKIVHTLSLAETKTEQPYDTKAVEIEQCILKLQSEIDAMHTKRYLGFSLYDAILNYFDNSDAPDCLRIDSLFYEKLTETTFNKYLQILTELSLRAKECGDIDKSPFKYVGKFEYTAEWRAKGSAILEIYLLELKQLKQYAKHLQPLLNMRTVSLTRDKLTALYEICNKLAKNKYVANYFKNYKNVDNARGIVDSHREALKRDSLMMKEYAELYGEYPKEVDIDLLQNGEIIQSKSIFGRTRKVYPANLDKASREIYIEYLIKCEQNKQTLYARTKTLADLFGIDIANDKLITEQSKILCELFDAAKNLYADCDFEIFNDCCATLTRHEPNLFLSYYVNAYENCFNAKKLFENIFMLTRKSKNEEINATIDYIISVQKNIDYMPSWCRYQEIVEKCKGEGFEFILEPLQSGDITANDILRCFKKCVYYNFVRSELYLDDTLCQFSGLTLEETVSRFKQLSEEYEKLTRSDLYMKLCAQIPRSDTAGDHNLERVILFRAEKNNMKGTTIRTLFEQIPTILKSTCPCMLMSPTSVTQFLNIDMEKFDLVVFDEASQIPTCEAISSIVRASNVIIVGDPKQLPPTTFFRNSFKDEEHYDIEDLESILDDCLALGMPERHLLWHYRSNHESLIAFSNSMYYDNTLLTFPSPNELNSRVTFRYVDGVYERGGSKCNKKEGDELIKEVISRLKNPTQRQLSIGIVTFNTAQQSYIEDKLSAQIHSNNLDAAAFERDEPLFVKNLENVQGDERDVILFSVGYGPDVNGKLSLNFGPINQSGGYKRLNVAVTRARTEMCVFSAITGNMIDLNRTDSQGVISLKAFLEYAERGREMLAIDAKDIKDKVKGIGALVASDLKDKGLICEYDVGVSDFKIDVAVVDPRNKDKYILAVICDSENTAKIKSVKDRVMLQTKILKKLGWNTYYMWGINYFNNPKREIAKIKDLITTLTEKKVISKKLIHDTLARYKRNYKCYYSKPLAKAGADYVLNFVNEESILTKIRAIIEVETPIESGLLLEKLMALYNVPKTAKKAVQTLIGYIEQFAALRCEFKGIVFFADKPAETFRPIDVKNARDLSKVHPEEIIASAKCAIECSLHIKKDELIKEVLNLFNCPKKTKAVIDWLDYCIENAIKNGELMTTVDDYLVI
ncbi:MAG: DUF4011 domain-containing protein [Clostridia bacterium]